MIQLITCGYRVNNSYNKKPYLREVWERIETIRIFFRLARDLRQVELHKFVDVNEQIFIEILWPV